MSAAPDSQNLLASDGSEMFQGGAWWWSAICSRLDSARDLCALIQTCRRVRELGDTPAAWRTVALARWGPQLADPGLGGYAGGFKEMVLDDNRRSLALVLSLPASAACHWRFSSPHAFYMARCLQLEWDRAEGGSLRLYFDVRGEADLRLPITSSLAVVVPKDGRRGSSAASPLAWSALLGAFVPDACLLTAGAPGHYKGSLVWGAGKSSQLLELLLGGGEAAPAPTATATAAPPPQHARQQCGRRSAAWDEWTEWELGRQQRDGSDDEEDGQQGSGGLGWQDGGGGQGDASAAPAPAGRNAGLRRLCSWLWPAAGGTTAVHGGGAAAAWRAAAGEGSSGSESGQAAGGSRAAADSGAAVRSGPLTAGAAAAAAAAAAARPSAPGSGASAAGGRAGRSAGGASARRALVFCYANDLGKCFFTPRPLLPFLTILWDPDYSPVVLAEPPALQAVGGGSVGAGLPRAATQEGHWAAAWRRLTGAGVAHRGAMQQQLAHESREAAEERWDDLPASVRGREGWWT